MVIALLLASGLLDYDASRPLNIRQTGVEVREGVAVKDITFAGAAGGRTAAYLVEPATARGRHAAVLFVRWYEPPNPTSNRTQFLGEAVTLAKKGVVSLLVETMWSEPE